MVSPFVSGVKSSRVQGSGFRTVVAASPQYINRAMPEGLLIAGSPRIVSLPLEGKVPRRGRIGHWRYEREWEGASQVDDL